MVERAAAVKQVVSVGTLPQPASNQEELLFVSPHIGHNRSSSGVCLGTE